MKHRRTHTPIIFRTAGNGGLTNKFLHLDSPVAGGLASAARLPRWTRTRGGENASASAASNEDASLLSRARGKAGGAGRPPKVLNTSETYNLESVGERGRAWETASREASKQAPI